MDSIFIFGLALILFGPKKLPEIGRQIGKIVLEFRKASNEFKMQIEDELRASEQAERQKKIAEETAALTAAVVPIPAALETSAPSALTIQPPTIGEQVSTSPPYRTGSEQMEAALAHTRGEDAQGQAEDLPPETMPAAAHPTNPAEQSAPAVAEHTVAPASEMVPAAPGSAPLTESTETLVQETGQATIHHG